MQNTGGVEVSRTALLSQEGSTIETAVEIVRGVVPKRTLVSVRFGNHPSRDSLRDPAALLSQEGNSPAFTVASILDSSASSIPN